MAVSYEIKAILPEGKLVYEYNPLYNYRKKNDNGKISDFITQNSDTYGDLLNFNLNNPVDIQCLESYDGSVNLILNDNLNQPRLINTRFTARENNTYVRVDRLGNTDTSLYDESEFEIDTSLLKKYVNIPKVVFNRVYYGGDLPVGNYVFYFKLSDADGNETDIVAESGIVTVHMGALNSASSIRGGQQDENSGKSIQFTLSNIDSGYDYVNVYYTRTTGVDNGLKTVTATRVTNRFRVKLSRCSIHITGAENSEKIPVSEISQDYFLASKAKTQAICLNMLFLGNVTKYTPDYETLSKLSLAFVPYYESVDADIMNSLNENYGSGGYYDTNNIYNKVGYWNEEIYRFGIVYIMHNGALSPVYNIRGINNVPEFGTVGNYTSFNNLTIDYDTLLIKEGTLENSAGVCRISETISSGSNYFKLRNFVFKLQDDSVINKLLKLNIKGYFFVRQKRIPTILCQAFMLGRDTLSGVPAWKINGNDNDSSWVTESFLDSRGYLTHDYTDRLVKVDDSKASVSVGICPEYELNQAYFNNIFTGLLMYVKLETQEGSLSGEEHHLYMCQNSDYKSNGDDTLIQSKIISVPDGSLVRDGNDLFRAKAGEAESLKYEYISNKACKPKKGNFSEEKTRIKFMGSIGKIKIENMTTKNKVRIVRGLYGTYLGFYKVKNKALKTNGLVNIYIPGYNVGQMPNYFNIRINCEDPYFAVSQRKELTEFNNSTGEKIFRGDCYISQFTHRINRNFLDPDAPNNDIIIESDTWVLNYDEELGISSEINRGDVNAVRIGTYLTFRCYSSMNLAMRDWDRGFPSEESLTGSKRSFYPLQPIRVDGHSKIPESCIYNQGFSTSLGEKVNFLQPAVPYIKNSFLTRIVYSDVAQTDAFKNGFRVFRGISFRDYSNQYGGLMKLVEWNDNLCAIFEHAVGIIKVNRDALIPTDDGTKIAVGAVKVLSDTPIMLSTDFGTQWPDSVCTSDTYIYGLDTVGKKIWRTNGLNFECISDFKVLKFLNDNITLGERELTPIIGVRNVKTHYNANKKDIMFTFYDNTYGFEETVWNLCWNEYQQAFTTFYSWVPSYSANIDNIFFSYDRNTSKWISKLALSNFKSSSAEGVCLGTSDSDGVTVYDGYSAQLHLKNRPVPDSGVSYTYTLEKDNFGNYKYFSISGSTLSITNLNGLIDNLLGRDPMIPVVCLNIKCNVVLDNNAAPKNGSKTDWDKYVTTNYGYYLSLVFLTFSSLFDGVRSLDMIGSEENFRLNHRLNENNTVTILGGSRPIENGSVRNEYHVLRLTTDFWKHGFAGLIDALERIKPCFWYGRQHPFEFEYIAGNDTAGYKRFDNLIISSNNVKPDSIHYTIVGDTYDFSCLKPAIYFRQEATKAVYQYNGSDILYDHKVFDKVYGYIPEMVTSSTYIETDRVGNTVRDKSAYSETYKDTLLPWLYLKQDTFNEIEDYYKKAIHPHEKGDYPNLTGGEVLWDVQFNKFSICNHVKARDVREVGRTRANILYINDKWIALITPLNVYNRNNTWFKSGNYDLPKLVLNNVPSEVFTHLALVGSNTPELPKEISENDSINAKYLLGKKGAKYECTENCLDATPWETIANSRKEVKLMDKYLKTRIRYKGDELVVILATVTQFNTIG